MASPPPLPTRQAKGGPPPLPSRALRTATGAVVPSLPSQRRDDVEFADEASYRSDREENPVLQGVPVYEWVAANSTYVNRMRFDPYPPLPNGQPSTHGRLFVEFLDQAYGYYDSIPAQLWVDFFNSSSKGRFVNDVLAGSHKFVELRGGQRKVTSGMRGQREPRTAYAQKRTYRKNGQVVIR